MRESPIIQAQTAAYKPDPAFQVPCETVPGRKAPLKVVLPLDHKFTEFTLSAPALNEVQWLLGHS